MLVWIRCSPFLIEIHFIFVTPFSQSWCYLVFCNQCQLSTPDNSLGSVEFLMWVRSAFGWMKHLFLMFSVCLRLSTSTSKLPFLVFLTVFGLALVDVTFSMRKGENLARQTSSKNSISMNPGKSTDSFFEFDSERFRLDFLFEDAIYAAYFSLALLSTTHHRVQLVLGMNQEVTHSPWLRRGYATSILELRVGFRAVQIPILNAIDPQPPPSCI